MAMYLVFALVLLAGQVQGQERVDEDVWEREFEFEGSRDQTAEGCYGKVADIFFALDSSTSIYINDYRQELQFVRDIVARLDISQRTTRVGVLSFSDDITRPPLDLNRFQTKSELLTNVNEQTLPYRTGITNTDQAIRYIRDNNLFREAITKIIVVVTDGGSRQPTTTARDAELAREQGFYLFVIGVGQYQDEREWRSIASDPDDTFIYNVTNFRVLDQVKTTLPTRACSLPPLEIPRRCNIERSADVYLVAAPGSIQNSVQVIDKLVEVTTDNGNYIRASYLLGICNNAESVPFSRLDTYCDRQSVPANPENFNQLLARLQTIVRRARGATKQVAILFLDDETIRVSRQTLSSEIQRIQQVDNVDIIIVDLGARWYGSEIQSLIPSRDNVVVFAPSVSVASQRAVLNTLTDRTCLAINGQTFTFGYTPS